MNAEPLVAAPPVILPAYGPMVEHAKTLLRTLRAFDSKPLVFVQTRGDALHLGEVFGLPLYSADSLEQRADLLGRLAESDGPGLIAFSAQCEGYRTPWVTDIVFVGLPNPHHFYQGSYRAAHSRHGSRVRLWLLVEGGDERAAEQLASSEMATDFFGIFPRPGAEQ